MTGALILLLAAAFPAAAEVAQENAARGSPFGLEDEITDAFVEFLEADPADPVALETAAALRSGEIPIRLIAFRGRSLGAVYDQTERAVLINLSYLATRYAAASEDAVDKDNKGLILEGIRMTWERNPASRSVFVSEMGPLIVHEVRHALFARKLGAHPSSIEEEMACHAYEALFVRRRLKADPDYLGFKQYDGLVRQYLKEPPSDGKRAWWLDPFPFSPIADVVKSVETVGEKFPGRFRLSPLLWLHVRSLSEGFGHFRLVFVSTYPQAKFSLEADPREVLEELEATGTQRLALPSRPTDGIQRIAVEFWRDGERVKKAVGLFAGEWARLERLLAAERSP